MFIYSLGIIYVLNIVGLWENHQIKNFIYWLIAFGIQTHFKKDTFSAKAVIKDTISLIVIFQFILTFYTFNLFFELVLILLSMILMAMKVLSETQENKEILIKFVNTTLAILGIAILVLSINQYVTHFNEFVNSKTFYDFLVPTILSIMIIPYFYAFFILIRYESAFVSLNFVITDNKNLRRHAKLKGTLAFNFDSKSFDKWSKNLISYQLDKEGIKQSIRDIKKLNKIEKNIYEIDIKKGWHPFIANKFLREYDISVGDYRRASNGSWSGYSNYIKIYEEHSDICYRIEGNLRYIDKLEVQLFFHSKEGIKIEKSYNLFVNMCKGLSIKAICHPLSNDILISLIGENDLTMRFYDKTIIVKHKSFETGAYKLVFIICK